MGEDGKEKAGKIGDDFGQCHFPQPSFSNKGRPLLDFLRVRTEFRSESHRDFIWDRGRAPGKGIAHRFGQEVSIKIEMELKPVEIVKILHPAVVDAKGNSSFQFFRDNGLHGISRQRYILVIERSRPLLRTNSRSNDVSKADIELQGDLHLPELTSDQHTDAAVAVLITDRRGPDIFPTQGIVLFRRELSDLRENLFQGGIMIAKAEKIGVPGRAVSFLLKKAEELSAFEDKAIRVVTLSEARKEAAQSKLFEHRGILYPCSAPFILEPVLE